MPFLNSFICHSYGWIFFVFNQIIIVGDLEKDDTQGLLRCVHQYFLPHKVLVHFNPDDVTSTNVDVTPHSRDLKADVHWLREQIALLEQLKLVDGKATAYVCENFTCSLPVTTVEQLEELLRK